MTGHMDGWMNVKAVLRIADSNQNSNSLSLYNLEKLNKK
jgi:hypothetical protein